jgi:regulatory protein
MTDRKNGAQLNGRHLQLVDEETLEPSEIDQTQAAKDYLLRRLNSRARTRSELAKELREKSFSDDVATEALDRLEEVGLINDDDFAKTWVSSRHKSKGLAGGVLRQELRKKGIADDTVVEALGEISQEEEYESAMKLAAKKYRALQREDRDTQIRRLVGFLARKGYPSNLCYRVAKEIVSDMPDAVVFEN